MLADESMGHKPLIIKGSSAFRKFVLTATAQANLLISFQDKLMQLAQLTAKKFLENVAEAQKQQVAQTHVEYINREKAYENRGGCIFQAHHLPTGAHDDPKRFFQAADKYEGIGHRRYVEIEFALPNELKTVEQYRQIIDTFIAKHLSDHYFLNRLSRRNGNAGLPKHVSCAIVNT